MPYFPKLTSSPCTCTLLFQNLGHHTAAFTLDVYGHVTEEMKRNSAARMDKFIKG